LWSDAYGLPARKLAAVFNISRDKAMKIKYLAEEKIKDGGL